MNIDRKIAEWLALRSAITEVERAEHPDLTDHHGRVWVWIGKDLYSHCSMAWPFAMVTDGQHQLPSIALHTNPNYDLCDTCKGEQTNAG